MKRTDDFLMAAAQFEAYRLEHVELEGREALAAFLASNDLPYTAEDFISFAEEEAALKDKDSMQETTDSQGDLLEEADGAPHGLWTFPDFKPHPLPTFKTKPSRPAPPWDSHRFQVPASPPGINTTNWMQAIADDAKLSDIAIPGTHDSTTSEIFFLFTTIAERIGCCQSVDIREQLHDGIRFFDLRLGPDGSFFHGPLPCTAKFGDILNECSAFLRGKPSETILMLLSHEQGEFSKFQDFCCHFFQKPVAQSTWHCSNDIPKLGDVRGKMVLVKGDDFGVPGLALNSFIRQNEWDPGTWKHPWRVRADMKLALIQNFLRTSRGHDKNKMLMNNWNKQWNPTVPVRTYADYINEKMQPVMNYPRGIQCMDYYLRDNVKRIIFSDINMKDFAKRR